MERAGREVGEAIRFGSQKEAEVFQNGSYGHVEDLHKKRVNPCLPLKIGSFSTEQRKSAFCLLLCQITYRRSGLPVTKRRGLLSTTRPERERACESCPVDPPPEAEGNFGGGNVGRE